MRIPLRLGKAVVLTALMAPSVARAQHYRIERIASGLNQPTYLTQAPGDPANILYFTERTSNTIAGFSVSNAMGKVWKYDVNARTKSLVLDLSAREVYQDTGLQTIAFPPDFNSVGSYGYQKMYLSASQRGTSALNKVEEYTIGPGGTAAFSKTILQYSNNRDNNHTVNWIGFDSTSTGAARNYLYISTGDGSYGNNYNSGTSTTGRPSQNPSDIAGKLLRIDVAGADAYPMDALKNFAIPATNPIPTYNAAHPDAPLMGTIRVSGVPTPAPALGEVWLTGIRNTYRASFDRQTGDLWMGDVGEVAREEVNFLKAGTNVAGPPVDYGWPQLEGGSNSNISGAPHTSVNPFTLVTALRPIDEFNHTGPQEGLAIIGGYSYRGPLAELQGKYFYTDFAGFTPSGGSPQNGKLWMAEFDRNTNPTTFNANNTTTTDITALWQALVVDPTDPSYLPDSTTGSSRGLDHIVSFGEDNAGNIYLVDFGNGSGFSGQYPGAGLGEIFRLTPLPRIPGDFDGDYEVDAADLAKWQTDFGNGGGSDADGDGDSDGNDLLVWQRNLGMSASAAANIGVPEPAPLGAVAAIVLVMLGHRGTLFARLRQNAGRRTS